MDSFVMEMNPFHKIDYVLEAYKLKSPLPEDQ